MAEPKEAQQMADVGADAVIAHVGTTVGGSIGVVGATCTMDDAVERTQSIGRSRSEIKSGYFLFSTWGTHQTPLMDVRVILDQTDAHGFVGASSIERMGVEKSLTDLTKEFKSLTLKK